MRSTLGPFLLILGLATAVVVVLLAVQTAGARSDVERLAEQVRELRVEVRDIQPGVERAELRRQLADLEDAIRTELEAIDASGPASSPGGRGADDDELVDRLDEVLRRIRALDDRLDQICEGVPVC